MLLAQDMLRGHGFGSRHQRRGLNPVTSGLGSQAALLFLPSEVLCLSHTAKGEPVLQERGHPPEVAFGCLPSLRMLLSADFWLQYLGIPAYPSGDARL